MLVWWDFSFDELAEQLEFSAEEHDEIVERDDSGELSIVTSGRDPADVRIRHHADHVEETAVHLHCESLLQDQEIETGQRWRWGTVKQVDVERKHMAYKLHCDTCELDQTFTEWADANWAASNHEADNPTHWVTILNTQPA